MPAIDLDVTAIVMIWMIGVIVLVPLMAVTARYGIAPVLDAVARLRAAGRHEGDPREGEGRVEALERRVGALTRAVARLEAAEAERAAPLV